MSDADKTPEELMAELHALRQRVEELESAIASQETQATLPEDTPDVAQPEAPEASQAEVGITKRALLHASWVAPVILTVNLPMSVFAQSQGSPGPSPVPVPNNPPVPQLPPIPTPTGTTTVAPTGTTTATPRVTTTAASTPSPTTTTAASTPSPTTTTAASTPSPTTTTAASTTFASTPSPTPGPTA